MGKPKQKPPIIKVPTILLAEKTFEFMVPYSPDECAALLHGWVGARLGSPELTIHSIDPDSYQFGIRWGGGLSSVYVTGELQQHNGASTRVAGKGGVAPEAILLFFMLVVGALVLIGMSLLEGEISGVIFFSACWLIIALAIWFGLLWARNRLLDLIYEAVHSKQ